MTKGYFIFNNTGFKRIMNGLIAVIIFTGWIDPFRDEVSEGNSKYHDKKYDGAREHYGKAEEYAPGENDKKNLSFNRGNADYMSGKYKNAIENYRKSLKSDDRDIQKKAFFNLGNTYMKLKKEREAIDSFINALKIDPGYEKAKKNIEYILKRREEKKDNRGKKGNDKDNKKTDEKKDDKNKKNPEKGNDKKQQKSPEEKRESRLNRDQIKNLLDKMKKKPVGRKKGNFRNRRRLDKNW